MTLVERVIDASSRNPFLVLVLTILSVAGGCWSLLHTPLDAIPDLSDTQVIIYTDWKGRSPDLVEDQITYPISSRFIAAPKVKFVRGESMFGESFVYVIFEDGTDIYWARSRVIEYLDSVRGSLPEGVNPVIGPDATGVGWVFEYALVDESGRHSLADLRSLQDWHLRYALESVKGVAEVAPVGGFVKQYQVDLDPNKLAAYGIPLADVVARIRSSNSDVGGKVFEVASTEYYVRGRGYIKGVADIEDIPLKVDHGTAVTVKNVGSVHIGPDLRRGVAELDGKGETVGGIVVMRYGENALTVIDGIKQKLREIAPSLPPGVRVVPTYDRSELIRAAIATLREKLIEESIVVALVCLVFLWHVRSALVAIITLPIAILLSFIPMHALGLTSNIMSLGGIAIAIGAMVDAAIIMVENAHKQLEHFREEHGREPDRAERTEVVIAAARSVGRPLFFSLLVITVSFVPVFSLTAQEGRLFKPLAFTKTFAMGFAALLGVTLVPVLMTLLVRGRIIPEERNPVNRSSSGPTGLRGFRAALPMAHARGRALHPGCDGHSLPAPGKGVHAAPQRGHDPLHAHGRPRHVDRRGDAHSPGPGPAAEGDSRGGDGVRQGRPGRDAHRPRAALDVRDGRDTQAPGAMAHRDDLGGDHRGDERQTEDPGHGQHLLDADPDPDGDADDRLPLSPRGQGIRSRPGRDPGPWGPDREGPRGPAGHAQRLRRAHDRRLLPGLHGRPEGGRPVRPHGG